MAATFLKIRLVLGMAAFCCAASSGAAAQAQSQQATGTSGVTAFQPTGSAHAEASAGATDGVDGKPQAGKPGFDNKPPKGVKETCHQPQGGVDASGGENISSSSKDNTSCTGKPAKRAKRG